MPISYEPFRQYLHDHNITWTELLIRGISNSTLQRLRIDQNITMKTLCMICDIVGCEPSDVIEYHRDENEG